MPGLLSFLFIISCVEHQVCLAQETQRCTHSYCAVRALPPKQPKKKLPSLHFMHSQKTSTLVCGIPLSSDRAVTATKRDHHSGGMNSGQQPRIQQARKHRKTGIIPLGIKGGIWHLIWRSIHSTYAVEFALHTYILSN